MIRLQLAICFTICTCIHPTKSVSKHFLKNIYIFKHFIVNVTLIVLPVLKQASQQLQKG